MSDLNDNKYYECPDFIRYLSQEFIRKGNYSPSVYSEIIKFIQSSDGIKSYQKFMAINPKKLGLERVKNNYPRRISKL